MAGEIKHDDRHIVFFVTQPQLITRLVSMTVQFPEPDYRAGTSGRLADCTDTKQAPRQNCYQQRLLRRNRTIGCRKASAVGVSER